MQTQGGPRRRKGENAFWHSLSLSLASAHALQVTRIPQYLIILLRKQYSWNRS